MKVGYGSCPGTCGELVQGYIGKNEYISSYCIDLYSRATVSEKKSSKKFSRPRKSKSIEASSLVFEYFGLNKNQVDNLHISIKSNIPIGKGMASSTADIGACIMATLDYLDKDMKADEISRLVAKIEATDSIFYPEVCIFDPIKGAKLILQSNNNHYELRKYLTARGFNIVDEEVIPDGKKTYINIIAGRDYTTKVYTELEYEFGPILTKNKNNLDYFKTLRDSCEDIYFASHSDEAKERLNRVDEIIRELSN